MEFRPEVEFRPKMEIPAETCEGGLGPLGQLPTSIVSTKPEFIPNVTSHKPEVTASYISQEVTSSFPIQYTQTAPVHSSFFNPNAFTKFQGLIPSAGVNMKTNKHKTICNAHIVNG